MRKIAFIFPDDTRIKKLMIHKGKKGPVYLFGYDTVYESGCVFDSCFTTIEDAEETCSEDYNLKPEDWIMISDLHNFCQQDYIMPVRVKGRETGSPQWGSLEVLSDGKWRELWEIDKTQSLHGLTVNERLFFAGLMAEFDLAKLKDKEKARKILEVLKVDTLAIEILLSE